MHATLTISTRHNTESLYVAKADSENEVRRLIGEARDWLKHSPHDGIVVSIAWKCGAMSSIVITRR